MGNGFIKFIIKARTQLVCLESLESLKGLVVFLFVALKD